MKLATLLSCCALGVTLDGCASFGVFKSANTQAEICSLSTDVLQQLEGLAKLYGVNLDVLVSEWSSACTSAAHAGTSDPPGTALKRMHTRAMELSKS